MNFSTNEQRRKNTKLGFRNFDSAGNAILFLLEGKKVKANINLRKLERRDGGASDILEIAFFWNESIRLKHEEEKQSIKNLTRNDFKKLIRGIVQIARYEKVDKICFYRLNENLFTFLERYGAKEFSRQDEYRKVDYDGNKEATESDYYFDLSDLEKILNI